MVSISFLFPQNKLKSCERAKETAEKRLEERSRDVSSLTTQLETVTRSMDALRKEVWPSLAQVDTIVRRCACAFVERTAERSY